MTILNAIGSRAPNNPPHPATGWRFLQTVFFLFGLYTASLAWWFYQDIDPEMCLSYKRWTMLFFFLSWIYHHQVRRINVAIIFGEIVWHPQQPPPARVPIKPGSILKLKAELLCWDASFYRTVKAFGSMLCTIAMLLGLVVKWIILYFIYQPVRWLHRLTHYTTRWIHWADSRIYLMADRIYVQCALITI
jgi:hypothetical protein